MVYTFSQEGTLFFFFYSVVFPDVPSELTMCAPFIGHHVSRKGLSRLSRCWDLYILNFNLINQLQGTATREDIDTTLKLGMNHPMGPLQLGTCPVDLSTIPYLISRGSTQPICKFPYAQTITRISHS